MIVHTWYHTYEHRYLVFTAVSAVSVSASPSPRNIIFVSPVPYYTRTPICCFPPAYTKRDAFISLRWTLHTTPRAKDVRSCETKALPDLDWREQDTTVPDLVLVELPPSVACAVVGSDSGGHFRPADKKSRSQLTAQQASHNALRQTRLIGQPRCPISRRRLDISSGLVRAPAAGEGIGCSWVGTYLCLLSLCFREIRISVL